ncbi:hypothetical protein F2P81_009100 [Scophthalmus maximus]|uniref:Uncharacterized protein n=1 Tax=Scophthalmus maximus TaxID=52904 RepID=A0A6A4STQ8_SCOMX|nr:hypothetical protein F2P81_009100 [Scophthalmus maximus]
MSPPRCSPGGGQRASVSRAASSRGGGGVPGRAGGPDGGSLPAEALPSEQRATRRPAAQQPSVRQATQRAHHGSRSADAPVTGRWTNNMCRLLEIKIKKQPSSSSGSGEPAGELVHTASRRSREKSRSALLQQLMVTAVRHDAARTAAPARMKGFTK